MKRMFSAKKLKIFCGMTLSAGLFAVLLVLLLSGNSRETQDLQHRPETGKEAIVAASSGQETPALETADADREQQSTAQEAIPAAGALFSATEADVILKNVEGGKRPPAQVLRGRNQRRIFAEPIVRVLAQPPQEPVHPFTGQARLKLDQHLQDHELAVSAIALGVCYDTFSGLLESEQSRIVIPLEEGLSVTFRVAKSMQRGPVTHTYIGAIEEHPESFAQLVFNDGAVTGHFVLYSDEHHPTRHYEIKYLTEDLVAVHKLDEEAFQPEHGDECRSCAMAAELDLLGNGEEDDLIVVQSVHENHAIDGQVVDIVVGYGRETRQADGGVANIEARILAAVDRMNQAFANSQIDGRMVLLGMIEDPDYLEADYTMNQTLYALRFGSHPNISDPLETVRAFRMALGADFAKFIMEDGEYAGLAYITHWASVSERGYVTTARFVFEHEVGHNLGALHAWGDTSGDTHKTHARYGWRFTRTDGSNKRRTIMAYDWSWSHVLHFSNPNVSYNLSGDMVKTGAVPGYNASGDPTVDPNLVSGGAIGGLGAGYDGSNAALGADVSGYFNTATDSGIDRAARWNDRASLAITWPQAGQTLIAWDATLIEWVGGTWYSPALIELYQGGTAPGNKVADIATLSRNGDRVYAWTPGAVTPGNDYRIRVINNPGETFEESAFSAVFSIEVPDTVQFQSAAYAVSENAGSLTVTVTRVGTTGAVSVDYATVNGTAIAGANFTHTQGTLNWADGSDAPQTFQVTVLDNGIYDDPALMFTLQLANVNGAIIHPADTATVTLTEYLAAPTYLVVYHANGAEGNVPDEQYKTHNIPLMLAGSGDLTKSGHTFVGWNTQANGTGAEYFAGAEYNANAPLTLYAQWVTGYTVVIDFGKPGQESSGFWNNITGDGDWPDGELLSPALIRSNDGGQTGVRLLVQRVTGEGRAGIGGHDIEPENQDAQAAFSVNGTIPGSAQRDIAYFTADGQAQFVFENLDAAMIYRVEFQTLHKTATAAGNWTIQPGTAHEQSRLVSRNKGAANYSPVQVFENVQADGAGRIVLRSAGDVAQNINAIELTTGFSDTSTFTVSYFGNNHDSGTPPVDANAYAAGASVTVLGHGDLAKVGHLFAGWNTQPNGEGVFYPAGATFGIGAANIDLYAQWITSYTLVIDFGKVGQETSAPGNWNNVAGAGDWPDNTVLLSSLVRHADGVPGGVKLAVERVDAAGRAGIGGLDITVNDQDADAAFTVSGQIPTSAQRDIAYFSADGRAQFVFDNLDDDMIYRIEFQSLHTAATAAGNWTIQPGTAHEQIRLVSRNKGAVNYSPVQVFEDVSTDGAGRIVLRSAGNVAQNINALELTARFAELPPEPPVAPTGLVAAAVSSTQITLSWHDNSDDEDGFVIERELSGSSSWSVIATNAANHVAFEDSGLAVNTGYVYRVKAIRGNEESAYSNIATARTWTVYEFPDEDGDGIDDRWMNEHAHHFGAGATADTEVERGGHTLTVRDIFIAGLNPADANAVFEIAEIGINGDGLNLKFQAASNRYYRLVAKDDLLSAENWTVVVSNIVGSGAERTLDALESAAPQRFYRLLVDVAPWEE